MSDRYAYAIYDLSDDEKTLVRGILNTAWREGFFTEHDLKRRSGGLPLRFAIGKKKQVSFQTETLAGETVTRIPDVPHRTWVFLYNYCMGELYDAVLSRIYRQPQAAESIKPILHNLERLELLAQQSRRYDTDMHVFNREIILTDTKNGEVGFEYLDIYISFRYSSTETHLVVAAIRISRVKERYIFNSLILAGASEREARGYAYQLKKGSLYLFGFMNEDHGGETMVLEAWDGNPDILYGLMTTVDNNNQPHSKHVLCVRASELFYVDIPDFGKILTQIHDYNALRSNPELSKLRGSISNFLSQEQDMIYTTSGREKAIRIDQFLERIILHPRNKPAPTIEGPTH